MALGEMDGLLVRTKKIFPTIYYQALFLHGQNLDVAQFTSSYAQRLRMSQVRVVRHCDHIVILPETLGIWITEQPLDVERKNVHEFILQQHEIRLMYILRLTPNQVWGCVQIPLSQLDSLKLKHATTNP